MLYFDFNNKTKFKVSFGLIKKINVAFLKHARLKGDWEYSLAFVGERKIRSLNRIFRNKDKVTDVLSFEEKNDGFIFGDAGRNFFGEIVICPSRAKNQARKYGWSFDKEIIRLLVHGLSHLSGYDHENVSAKKAQEMFDFENDVIKAIR
jgi:probable rRNA maturation factor